MNRCAVLGHDQRLLRKIEHLTSLLGDLRIRREQRPTMLADLGRVLDDRVGLGDLAQRVAAMALLAPAPLARARAQALQDPRLLLQPVARGRLGTVGAVQPQPSPKLGVLRFQRLDPAHRRGDKLFAFGGNSHPTLESEIRLPVAKNCNVAIDPAPGVAFWTHPGLAVTFDADRRSKPLHCLVMAGSKCRACSHHRPTRRYSLRAPKDAVAQHLNQRVANKVPLCGS